MAITMGKGGHCNDIEFANIIKALIIAMVDTIQLMQGILEDFDDLFVAAGSAGTICGLAIAKYLSGAKIK